MQKVLKYISIGIICVCSFLFFSFDNVFADDPLTDGTYYFIYSSYDNNYLISTYDTTSASSGSLVYVNSSSTDNVNNLFYLKSSSDGYYYICNVGSGLFLRCAPDESFATYNSFNASDNYQKFRLVSSGDSYYIYIYNTTYNLVVYYNTLANNQKVNSFNEGTGFTTALWKFGKSSVQPDIPTPTPSGSYNVSVRHAFKIDSTDLAYYNTGTSSNLYSVAGTGKYDVPYYKGNSTTLSSSTNLNPVYTQEDFNITFKVPGVSFINKYESKTYGHHTYYLTFDQLVSGSFSYTISTGSTYTVYLYKQSMCTIELASALQGNASTITSYDYSNLYVDNSSNVSFDKSSNFYKDDSNTSTQLNNNVTNLNNNISSVDQLQSSYSDSMTDNFSKISSSDVGLVKNNSFVNSSIWVVTQFNNLIDVETKDGYKPFNLMLFYSLFLGVALILIGKIRS